MPVRSNRLPLVAALMIFGQPVLAGEKTLSTVKVEAEAEQTSRETYQTTRTRIGKGEQDLRDIPQSLTVVTERLIDDRNLDTLKETLHNTAGISFLAAEGGEEDRAIAFTPEGGGRAMKRGNLGGALRFCDGSAGCAWDTGYPGATGQGRTFAERRSCAAHGLCGHGSHPRET